MSRASLVFARELTPASVRFGVLSKAVVALFAAVVAANVVAVFFEEGFHWTLPDSPTEYRLLHP